MKNGFHNSKPFTKPKLFYLLGQAVLVSNSSVFDDATISCKHASTFMLKARALCSWWLKTVLVAFKRIKHGRSHGAAKRYRSSGFHHPLVWPVPRWRMIALGMMKDDDGRDAATDSTRFAGMARCWFTILPRSMTMFPTVDQGDPRLATNSYDPYYKPSTSIISLKNKPANWTSLTVSKPHHRPSSTHHYSHHCWWLWQPPAEVLRWPAPAPQWFIGLPFGTYPWPLKLLACQLARNDDGW